MGSAFHLIDKRMCYGLTRSGVSVNVNLNLNP